MCNWPNMKQCVRCNEEKRLDILCKYSNKNSSVDGDCHQYFVVCQVSICISIKMPTNVQKSFYFILRWEIKYQNTWLKINGNNLGMPWHLGLILVILNYYVLILRKRKFLFCLNLIIISVLHGCCSIMEIQFHCCIALFLPPEVQSSSHGR